MLVGQVNTIADWSPQVACRWKEVQSVWEVQLGYIRLHMTNHLIDSPHMLLLVCARLVSD